MSRGGGGGELLLPDDLSEIITKNGFLSIKEHEGGHKRIHCRYTGHEIVPRKSDVERHLQSAKLRKAKEWYSHDYSQYCSEHIVKHKDNPKLLYCHLTRTALAMQPNVVKAHISGKKFNACLKAHEERKRRNKKKDFIDESDSSVGSIEEKEEELVRIGLTTKDMACSDESVGSEGEVKSENEERGSERRKSRVEVATSGGIEEQPRAGVRNKKKRKLERQHILGKKNKKSSSKYSNGGANSTSTSASSAETKNSFSIENTHAIDDAKWEAYKAKHTMAKIKKAKEERMRAKEIRMGREKVED